MATITSCDNCGACCRHVGVPMGFHHLIDPNVSWLSQDAELAKAMPKQAKEVYLSCKAAIERGEYDPDGPCCWLDSDSKQCRWYEYRPSVCREFEVGTEYCLNLGSVGGSGRRWGYYRRRSRPRTPRPVGRAIDFRGRPPR
jgi:uncharacterized protein